MSNNFTPATETLNQSLIASMAEGMCLQMANGEIAALNPAAARDAIVSMCRAMGLTTEAAANARDALHTVSRAAAAKRPFDLVLLDSALWQAKPEEWGLAQPRRGADQRDPPQANLDFLEARPWTKTNR
jgi:hypothetical protein